MYSAFLGRVRGIISFEDNYGVPPRTTPFGWVLPNYHALGTEEGNSLWEKHYGPSANSTQGEARPRPFSVVSGVPR